MSRIRPRNYMGPSPEEEEDWFEDRRDLEEEWNRVVKEASRKDKVESFSYAAAALVWTTFKVIVAATVLKAFWIAFRLIWGF